MAGSVIRLANLRQDWAWVRPLIASVIERWGEAYLPEDVYAAVSSGKSAMWVSDEPEGVLVAYAGKMAWSDETVLHVWICVCDDMAALEAETYAVLADAARKLGAKRIIMESPRPGWQRKGWKVARYIYERALT